MKKRSAVLMLSAYTSGSCSTLGDNDIFSDKLCEIVLSTRLFYTGKYSFAQLQVKNYNNKNDNRRRFLLAYDYLLGYKVHPCNDQFRPNMVLFSKGQENITVSMVQDATDYILSILSHKNPLIAAYKTAMTVIRAVRVILANKRVARPSKEDIKVTVDVLEEIMNQEANSDIEKESNARNAYICKLMIDQLYSKPSLVCF